ncbi:MAG: hydrogenase maturation nickel metallochaperone HypA [Armatimonadetes bacterium]|nr:hydrogenase maturation nickel metallochaperone HypA [Armatimonadota bacterium]MCX7969363.1 hydrogenase maturation nickel metallochaperone HypA [Armatimonadota bacterium]MDW8142891.1 hydrogenase maturation nickel metallochaperone HypA [Armatimonadota bacterium]
MHEFDVVKSLIDLLLPKLKEQGVKKVTEVRFRRGSTFSEDALLEAFSAISKGTPLEGAKVEVVVTQTRFRCPCGHEQVITADDLVGHMFVCPICGQAQEIDEAHDLELLEVVGEV